VLLSAIFGSLIPLLCDDLDKLDLRHRDTPGYEVTVTQPSA
jgi:hypothetical protein